ncbi:MAG TPA: hypothetical protein P5150_09420 [Candidatus Ratteibacteria bacterium]|nr:hypothetical protein [Candidatus Ratteibacteria bacterium]
MPFLLYKKDGGKYVQEKTYQLQESLGPIATYVSILIENLDNLYQYTEPL